MKEKFELEESMKKKFRLKKTYLIIAMIVIGSITAGMLWGNFDEFQGNWINVTSFIISIIALIIALITRNNPVPIFGHLV